jgi:ABC-type glycerol-3-phosphate transport system substrate-binding protein
MATFALSACTFRESPPELSEANSSGLVTITFGASEDERMIYSPLIASFNQANPAIRVQFVALDPEIGSSDPGVNALKEAVSAVDTTVRWSVQPENIQRGYYYDLKPLMDADLTFDPSDFYLGALESVSTAGTVAALPRTLSLPLLSYNKDLWAKHGLPPPASHWTWQDLTTSAMQLASADGNTTDTYGLLEWSGGLSGLYGLPYAVVLRFLAYNQDAFDAAGIEHPTADWTLDDFQRAAQTLTHGEGAAKYYGFTGPAPTDLFFFLDRLGASLTLGSDETLQPTRRAASLPGSPTTLPPAPSPT